MAFTMYSYFNETTGDLVISGQEETLDDGYTQLDTPETNPDTSSGWPWHSSRDSIKTVHIGATSPVDVTSARYMFYRCSNLTSVDLSSFDTSKVADTYSMFYGCSSIASLDLSNFDTSHVTGMVYMFYDCRNLTSLNLLSFDTSHVTSMRQMFDNCSSLTSLNLSNFDTSKVTDMAVMFYRCSNLTSVDLSSFNTSHVTNMSSMFDNCSSLTSLDLSNFDTSHVTDMGYMFCDCSRLTSLDLSNFDTSQVTDMAFMFYGCPLHIIDIPTAATNIVSQLPLENTYYDAATGTSYFKANIPGGSVYVDDPEYIKTATNVIQTRRGISNAKNTINSRISSIRNGYHIADSRRPARMYIVNDESDSESVTGKKVMRPCVLMVVGSGDVTPVYAS